MAEADDEPVIHFNRGESYVTVSCGRYDSMVCNVEDIYRVNCVRCLAVELQRTIKHRNALVLRIEFHGGWVPKEVRELEQVMVVGP